MKSHENAQDMTGLSSLTKTLHCLYFSIYLLDELVDCTHRTIGWPSAEAMYVC